VAEAFVGSRIHVDFAAREPAVAVTAPGRAALGPRLTPVLVVMNDRDAIRLMLVREYHGQRRSRARPESTLTHGGS
jgi:hypothetical protein